MQQVRMTRILLIFAFQVKCTNAVHFAYKQNLSYYFLRFSKNLHKNACLRIIGFQHFICCGQGLDMCPNVCTYVALSQY